MLQSPTRIEELVKIFIHATKVSPNDMSCKDASSDPCADGDWFLGNGTRPMTGLMIYGTFTVDYNVKALRRLELGWTPK